MYAVDQSGTNPFGACFGCDTEDSTPELPSARDLDNQAKESRIVFAKTFRGRRRSAIPESGG